jgi:fatty-acyl-CoA synthase
MSIGDPTPNLSLLFGDQVALFDADRGISRTYRQLAEGVENTAATLADLGVAKGDRICILAKNRIEHLELFFACGRLGAIFVPLNWRLAERELAFLLDDAEPNLLFFSAEFSYLAGSLGAGRQLTRIILDAPEKSGNEPNLDAPESSAEVWVDRLAATTGQPTPQANLDLNDPWLILYTSGTTGHPKGALIPHRQVHYNVLNTLVALGLTRADATVTYTPFFHTGALHVLTTPLLWSGGRVILVEGFDPEKILQINIEEGATLLFGVPTTLERLASENAFDQADLSRIRLALCGGAPCPLSLIERYAQRGIVFKQGYGLTEVGPNCLNLNAEDVEKKAGSAGRPNLHIAAQIRDERDQVVQGPGRGELCLGGPAVCLGYWRRPEANAAVFTADHFFRTGDIVERDADGYYTIVDRKKDMFISGGENVYPAEVEKVYSDHPEISAVAVIGISDETWGEVGRAYLEVGSKRDDLEKSMGLDGLKAWGRERLAAYKVPKEFRLVAELPRNASGKIVKKALTEGKTP